MSAKPRILLVGAGRFGSEHLLEWNKLAAEGVVTLAGIAVATERSRDALQKRTGLPVHAPFTDDLLADVDAVDLATPSATHAALVRRCLPRVHVLVEKPLAPTPEEARELGAIASRSGRVLMVGHVYRYHPVVRKLAELVAEIPERPRAIHGVLVNPQEDGVEHLDINLELLHPFDIIDYLFGAKPSVSIGRRRNLTHRVSLRYPGPMHAVLRLGWQGAQKIRTLDLSYADRQIRCNFVDNSIVISTRADQVEKLFFPHEHGALAQQFRAFVGAISGKSDEKYPDAEVSARVVEVARRAAPRAEPGRPRVAVVGGGIFGATCALELAKTCDVTLYERHSSLMTEVSFLNQWRHHSGFHYPRSYDTIQEIKAAKGTFEAEYGEAIVRRYPSYFCTSNTGVEIPAERYLAAVQGNNLNFSIQAPPAQVLDHSTVSISLKSDEAVYDYPKLKHIVEQRLNANPRIKVMLRTAVVDADIAADGSKVLKLESADSRGPSADSRGHSADKRGPTSESFDYLINATYANLNLVAKWFGFPVEPLRFDIYELLVLRIPIPQICVTIMDGPFTSLVGMGFDDMFMLSHIHDSVLRSVITEDGLPPKWGNIRSNRENMLRHSSRYLPILKQATVLESRYATRTVNAYARDFDARPTVVRSHGFGVWSVLGGKILTCVTNAREIASEITAEREDLSLRSIA